MKKKVLRILITSVVIFSGCSNKDTVNDVSNDKEQVTKSTTEAKQINKELKSGDSTNSNATTTETKAGSAEAPKPIKAGTVPQLSAKQKEQINTNVNSTIKGIEDALKSIETPKDIKVE